MTAFQRWPVGTLAFSGYRLPLARAVRVGPAQLAARSGVLVRCVVDGAFSYGDAAPLPGLSREHVDDVVDALREGRAALAAAAQRLPSLGFALDAASMRTRSELAALHSDGRDAILLGDTADVTDVVAQLATACEAHRVRVAKLKVGRGPRAGDVARVRAVAALCGTAGIRLRLDGNRSLDAEGARTLAQAAGAALEYFEEPVPPESVAFIHGYIPLAFDETFDALFNGTFDAADDIDVDATLRRMAGPAHAALMRAAAWVLKPTVLGPSLFLGLAAAARRANIRVILSSCYESSVGRAQVRALAEAVDSAQGQQVHGIGTASAFASDIDLSSLALRPWTVVS